MTDLFSYHRIPMIDCGENPMRIPDDDPLLRQLFREYPDRRYEVLTFERGKYKRNQEN